MSGRDRDIRTVPTQYVSDGLYFKCVRSYELSEMYVANYGMYVCGPMCAWVRSMLRAMLYSAFRALRPSIYVRIE